ncbi:MAG: hypothetical protein HYV96_06950 [Opitutae bacterium]|nr:hypothetical protein [Opitutae bacterium]
MRRSKEIVVLLVLLVSVMAFVLWYVRQRRAELRARPAAEKVVGPVVSAPAPIAAAPAATPAAAPAPEPVDLTKHEAKTIDFSSGKPVVKDTPEDRAALQEGLKDIEEATRNVTFKADKKDPKKP